MKELEVEVHEVLAGGGDMGARMRALDWEDTELGSVASWPQSLRSALSICLGSRFPIAIYWGPRLNLLYNDAWSPIPGTKSPWALGRPAKEVWPEIWETIGPLFEQVMTTGVATYSEDSLLPMHRHGYTEECYFNFTFSPIRGEGGRVEGVFNAVIETTFRVISDRRTRLLRELGEQTGPARSAEQACKRAASVLGSAPHDVPFCALYLTSADGTSAELTAHAGIPQSSALPQRVALDREDPLTWPLCEVHRTGKVEVVSDLRERFGMPLPGGPWPEPAHTALVAPIAVVPGQVAAFLVLGTSPRRALDEEYRQFATRAAAQLANVVATAAAYDAERKRAEALAEVDRAKTIFFSNVSHEFRTPLTLMLGPTEELLAGARGELNERQREQVETLHRNELRLVKLVNTLLDFSRIEAGRFQARYTPTDLAVLTRDLASVFRAAMEKAGLEYIVHCEPLPDFVFVDVELWEKIVFNLLSNAFKFTLSGRVELHLAARGDHVELSVRDSGAGIRNEDLDKLFRRFYRGDGVRSRSYEGSGIGLALVHELVKMHGGTIRVESSFGHGSCFTISLPFGSDHLPQDRVETTASARSLNGGTAFVEEALRWLKAPEREAELAEGPASGLRAHVIVADDNADMRDYVARVLREEGLSVTCVSNGREALEASRKRTPDLLISDVMMPELDGFGLLRALRRDATLHSVPVLILSARAGEEARVEGIEAGADDYLIKPFAAKELVARARSQLESGRMRRAAEAERNRFRALLSQVPATVNFLRGPDLIVEFLHPHGLKMLGDREVIGKPLLEALPEFRGQEYPRLLRHVFETGERLEGREKPVLHYDGNGQLHETFWNFVYLPLRDAHGRIEGVMTFDVEVTEQVRSRKRLEDQTKLLERAKREADDARMSAESANRAKDDFLALLGHELRNPLAPIVTALAVMDMRGLSGCERERAIIARQVQHLARLVDDLLDVSRIARGKIDLRCEPVELSEVVGRALEASAPLFEARRQHVAVSVAVRGLLVNVDASRMQQVISNLLTNAAKYTDPEGEISVSAQREGAFVALRVADNGMGIDPHMLPRVFDLFAQETQALDRSRGGLGLGLAIVRNIVELHHGSVRADSRGRGHGSEFTIRLPLAAVQTADRKQSAQRHRDDQVERKQRILLVDDNEDALETLAAALSEDGFDVRTASDGPGALRLLNTFVPDVAILDIGLPAMDGYELARALRARLDGRKVRVIALTGYGQEEDKERSVAAGFDHHLVKPLDYPELYRLLCQEEGQGAGGRCQSSCD